LTNGFFLIIFLMEKIQKLKKKIENGLLMGVEAWDTFQRQAMACHGTPMAHTKACLGTPHGRPWHATTPQGKPWHATPLTSVCSAHGHATTPFHKAHQGSSP
jgi:hypothetical protein